MCAGFILDGVVQNHDILVKLVIVRFKVKDTLNV